MSCSPLGLSGQVWGRKFLLGASPNEVGVRGCHSLLEGYVDALRLIPRCSLALAGVAPSCVVLACALQARLRKDMSSMLVIASAVCSLTDALPSLLFGQMLRRHVASGAPSCQQLKV